MKLVVFSHKPCWPSTKASGGYASNGGFPFQMQALSKLFKDLILVLPLQTWTHSSGEIALLSEPNMSLIPLTWLAGTGWRRKVRFPIWVIRNWKTLGGAARSADAIHAPIPGDIGTIGIFLALILRKPLLVRHCGNWLVPRSVAERFWIWLMERIAGGRNVMLATGGQPKRPSSRNPNIHWIFSTSMSKEEIASCAVDRSTRIPTPSPRLITVCRQEPEKGTDIIISALPTISRQFPLVTLDIVGDGSALSSLRMQAKELGVDARVRFHGNVAHKEVLSLLHLADLFCYPTTSEGFPKAVHEALTCNLPVITTRVSVLPQLLEEGSGLLLKEISPEALAEAVIYCLNDLKVYSMMAVQAGRTASQYSLESWREKIRQHLNENWSNYNI